MFNAHFDNGEKEKKKKGLWKIQEEKKKSLLWIYQSKSLSAPPYQFNHHCTLEKVIICMHSLETKTGHKKIYRKVLSFSEMNINVSFLLVPISDNIQTDLLSPFCHSPSNTRYQYWPLADRYPWQGQATTSQTYQHHWPKNTIKVAPLGSINASSGLPSSAFGALLQQELHVGSEGRLVKGKCYLGFW